MLGSALKSSCQQLFQPAANQTSAIQRECSEKSGLGFSDNIDSSTPEHGKEIFSDIIVLHLVSWVDVI